MGRKSNAKERLMEAIGELIWVGSYGSTSVDDICEKAGVKKGSFYYFFESKADLAIAAIDAAWQVRRGELDTIFSSSVPPLERFKKLADYLYESQKEVFSQFNCVLGCPLYALGAEVSTHEERLQQKIQEVLDCKRKYIESAIRDADAEGVISAPDPAGKARIVFTYYHGLLTEARIRNDLQVLKDAELGIFEVLGVKSKAAQAA